jgi:hypothetical protein
MSSLLDRIGAFFLEPRDDRESAAPAEPGRNSFNGEPTAAEQAPAADGRSSPLGFASSSAARPAPGGFAPPAAGRPVAAGRAASSDDHPAFGGFAPPAANRSHPDRIAGPSASRSDAAWIVSTADPGVVPDRAVGSGPPVMTRDGAPVQAVDPGRHVTGPVFTEIAFAAVLGAPAEAVPVAAACAGELRAHARAAAALLCVWGGGEAPAGATTPAVRRLAARLAAHGLGATASGRLAWVALDSSPARAATQVMHARALAATPIVLAVAGPRPAALEPLVADADLALVVLAAEAEEPLRALALETLPSRVSLAVPPLPPGPPRWAAMAGLARMRSLKPASR